MLDGTCGTFSLWGRMRRNIARDLRTRLVRARWRASPGDCDVIQSKRKRFQTVKGLFNCVRRSEEVKIRTGNMLLDFVTKKS